MTRKLILVDYENITKIDLSGLDDSYRAIVFVGFKQKPPKALKMTDTPHSFDRVKLQRIEGSGKNALDFHIAFQLGRTMETEPQTECFVLSKDKGFDPLLSHLNKSGLKCNRITCMTELIPSSDVLPPMSEKVLCIRCVKASTIEHRGGLWCSNCGCFSTPPDPGYREPQRFRYYGPRTDAECSGCHETKGMAGGIFDDGKWLCRDCVVSYAQ
ncbi:PIN domain-containing protein [Candidatus Accumulibacter sp. ACC012]|uniref:PIN domain-containing protein n=1 Tax=Candidatus Accumulibacter sp. ACC012 TaxID=2823332 RepID=UPI0034445208